MATALLLNGCQPTGDGQTKQTGDLLGTRRPADDANRFQAWQVAALKAHPAGTELRSFGPFRAVLPAASEGGSWVTIVEGSVDKGATDKGVEALRAIFKRRNAVLEIEYNEALFPGVQQG